MTDDGTDDPPAFDPAGLGLDDALAPPPIPAALEAELGALAPVAARRPWRDLAVLTGAAALSVAAFVLALALRRDLDQLPVVWVVAFAAAWIVSFALAGGLALVPRAGAVMPRARAAALVAGGAAVGFVVAGLLFARTTPASLVYAPTVGRHLYHAALCLGLGAATAALPLWLGLRLLRGAVPVGARGAGAGLGAACASAGGLLLHLHCPITHAFHVGVGHGGVVALVALVGAAAAAASARRA